MKTTASLVGASLALTLLGFTGMARAFGPPDWAKPFLDRPAPQGSYIAAADAWVIPYAEVIIGGAGPHLEEHWRLLLQNRSLKPQLLAFALVYDSGQDQLGKAEVFVEKTVWHKSAMEKKAIAATGSQGERTLLVTSEAIQPGKRVALEYALRDQLGFNPWRVIRLPLSEPTAELKVAVAAGSGLALELVNTCDSPLASTFQKNPDGSFQVLALPGRQRLRAPSLVLQPTVDQLFPYFLAFRPGSPGESLSVYASYFASAWQEIARFWQDPELQSVVAACAAHRASVLEKAEALTGFAQFEVQYDASTLRSVENWLPRPPAEILRSRRGDCKAKTLLAQALLATQGIASVPILLRVEDAYFKWQQRPGSAFFNHVVLAVQLEGLEKPLPATLQSGPLAGWVLFDPTLQAVRFGQPLPGYEGLPALAIGTFANPVFAIATAVPSTAVTRVEGAFRVQSNGELSGRLKLKDNGESPLVSGLIRSNQTQASWETTSTALLQRFPGARLAELRIADPQTSPSGQFEVELVFTAPNVLSPLGNQTMMESPFALAANLAGWAASGPVLSQPQEEEAIRPGPPWENWCNCQGVARTLEASLELELPHPWALASPSEQKHYHPWLDFQLQWEVKTPGRWQGTVVLQQKRGCWPAEQRGDHFKSLGKIRKTLFAPLLLTSKSVAKSE